MKTIPTLLTTSHTECIDQIHLFQRYFDRIQLDIADGDLVPNRTTQIDDIIELLEKNMITLSPAVRFDFHLMVQDFEAELEKIVALQELNMSVDTVLINAGRTPNIAALSSSYTFSIGLDVFPSTQIDTIARQYDLDFIPSIQIMTVEPGFQGSPFLPDMLNKITQLRNQDYSGEILIDGGVNSTTIPLISSKEYKPDILCIGSYLTKAGDELDSRINELRKLE